MLMLTLLILILNTPVHSYERSDAFVVRLYDKRIRVLAPKKFDPSISVIVENKTLVKSISRIEKEGGVVIQHFSVMPGSFKAIDLKIKKGEVIYLVPLSPPFQRVELVTGRRPYEIPAKR